MSLFLDYSMFSGDDCFIGRISLLPPVIKTINHNNNPIENMVEAREGFIIILFRCTKALICKLKIMRTGI